MIALLLLLAFVLAVATGVGLTLRRLYGARSEGISPALKAALSAPARSALETYQPMSRLFAEEDFRFLSGLAPALVKRLRRQRRHVMRLYLRELQADFERIYAFCRALAPRSQDPSFATLITKQALSFYGLFVVLQMRCGLGWFLPVRVDTGDLVDAFDRLHQAAQAALQAMASQPIAASQPA